jgi:hypothetical protein
MYCTAKDVAEFSGIKESDFDISNHGEYETLVNKWIAHADAIIDADRGRSFDIAQADSVHAPLLQNLSMRITANIMAQAQQNRTLPVEKMDDFSAKIIRQVVVTDDIKADLKRLPGVAKLGIGIAAPPSPSP